MEASLDAQRWRVVERILDAALNIEPQRWPSLLDSMCAGDSELRSEVDALLNHATAAHAFLDAPPTALVAALLAEGRAAMSKQAGELPAPGAGGELEGPAPST